MNQLEYSTTDTEGPSQADIILETLKQNEGTWISMPSLASLSGSMNVHSRISDLTKRGYIIKNRTLRYSGSRKLHSAYMLCPSEK